MNKNLLVVDIQPAYKDVIYFSIPEFIEFLTQRSWNSVTYLYNGESCGYSDFYDAEEGVVSWLNEYSDDEELDHLNNYDKGYGFFRDIMDYADDEDIIKLGRWMIQHGQDYTGDLTNLPDLVDELELSDEVVTKLFINEISFYIPEDLKDFLDKADNYCLVGGGENECLAEIKLLLEMMGKNYEIEESFIF